MKKIFQRIHADYFMSSRIDEYEKIIATANEQGYEHLTITRFYALISQNKLNTEAKYFIHRHDIDTDTKTARLFFNVEKKHKVHTSYYFRLSTIDVDLMKEIHSYGSEVGYHYEELAQYCKDHRIKSKTEIEQKYPELKKVFTKNFNYFQEKAGFKIKTIASHGDFVNRKIGLSNFAFLDDATMKELQIDFECYDPILLKNYKEILSDTIYPTFYKPRSPFQSMKEGCKVIYLLSHPRHWKVARWINTKDNAVRLMEGIKYKM